MSGTKIDYDEIEATFAKTPTAQAVSIWPTLDQTRDYLMLYKTEQAQKPFAMVSMGLIFSAIRQHGLLAMDEDED